MKALFVALCVLAAFIGSETLQQCYNCPERSLKEHCEANAAKQNCSGAQNICITRIIFYNDTAINQNVAHMHKSCYESSRFEELCNASFMPNPLKGYSVMNCTKAKCKMNLCNSSPEITTASSSVASTTSVSTRFPTITKASPPTSCGQRRFYKNSVVVALVLLTSLVPMNSF